ncbi:Coiled-coil domain-containing protein 51 [Homalodisca vitripennis]|nr:Coiled-coil domain-containing protein 51 [Homalodisca vitripennis]
MGRRGGTSANKRGRPRVLPVRPSPYTKIGQGSALRMFGEKVTAHGSARTNAATPRHHSPHCSLPLHTLPIRNSSCNLSEQEERECFTFLSSSVKESHEKERAQAERTKYWSVIGSVVGTVIGVIGSSINNEFKMRELRKLVMESAAHSQQSAEVDKMAAAVLTRHEEQLNQIIGEMRSVSNSSGAEWGQGRGPTLHLVDNPVGVPLDLLLEEQRRETRIMLGLAVVVIPVLVACVNRFL